MNEIKHISEVLDEAISQLREKRKKWLLSDSEGKNVQLHTLDQESRSESLKTPKNEPK